MKEKLKERYHKFDYTLVGNFLLETIEIAVFMILLSIFLFLLGHKEVKAQNIPAPNTFDTYNSNGSYNTYSSQLYSSWWWGYNLYSVSGNTGFSSPRQDYVWTNFRQYCNDVLNLSGSFTSLYYDEVYDKFNVYIYNGGKGNLCSTRYDTSSHLVYFDCSITMSSSNAVALSIQNKTGNEFLPHGLYVGLITTSQYSCSLDASSIINNQNNNTQTIINNNNNNTNQIINNQNQNNDKLIDSIQGDDINTDDIPVRDDDTLNNYNKAEDDLLGDDLDLENTININSNKNAMSWIWELITKILNWNEKVFSFIISVLSIGLIKLILCR